jgi:hypothetical protein
MTFLQLVQALHTECGASGTAPQAVTNQRGESQRFVNWILRADRRIQGLWVNWKFLRAEYSQPTTEDEATMPGPDDLGAWDLKTFRIIEEGTTEPVPLEAVEYEKVKQEIPDTRSGIPYRAVVMPDNTLRLDPPPDGEHQILADYWTAHVPMSQNTSESTIPEEFHDAILGRAMMFYGRYENAPEILEAGQELYEETLARLENKQLPNEDNSRYRTDGFFEVIAE